MPTKRPEPAELFPVIYGELRRVAGRYLSRERRNHTLQPTALVHEAWLKLQNDRNVGLKGRTNGLALAAQAMRRLLVDHGRHQKRDKRGGGVQPVVLDDLLKAAATAAVPVEDLLTLESALTRLEARTLARLKWWPCAFSRACRRRKSPNICRSRCERWRATGRSPARGSSAISQARATPTETTTFVMGVGSSRPKETKGFRDVVSSWRPRLVGADSAYERSSGAARARCARPAPARDSGPHRATAPASVTYAWRAFAVSPVNAAARAAPRCASGYSIESGASPR